jgi:subtilisin family serine protease
MSNTNDPLYKQQWHMQMIGMESVWGTKADGTGVVVAILDTGIDTDHPFFAGRLVDGA